MARFKVGVQLHPQHTTAKALRQAWRTADQMGVDSIWLWDHFFPLYGDPSGPHFESWTLMAAMAVETDHAQFGAMVTGNGYRNPDLLADMARTIDHLGEGRFVLGIGAGWFQKDYREYGYDFGTTAARLRQLSENLPRIKNRLAKLNPPPIGKLPILVGGGGERVTLKLVAQYADMWNTFPPASSYGRKLEVLKRWCDSVGRNLEEIERTIEVRPDQVDQVEDCLKAGAQHLIMEIAHPFDLKPVERLLEMARK
jgi:probable F420-dependent oxidoreductase